MRYKYDNYLSKWCFICFTSYQPIWGIKWLSIITLSTLSICKNGIVHVLIWNIPCRSVGVKGLTVLRSMVIFLSVCVSVILVPAIFNIIYFLLTTTQHCKQRVSYQYKQLYLKSHTKIYWCTRNCFVLASTYTSVFCYWCCCIQRTYTCTWWLLLI